MASAVGDANVNVVATRGDAPIAVSDTNLNAVMTRPVAIGLSSANVSYAISKTQFWVIRGEELIPARPVGVVRAGAIVPVITYPRSSLFRTIPSE